MGVSSDPPGPMRTGPAGANPRGCPDCNQRQERVVVEPEWDHAAWATDSETGPVSLANPSEHRPSRGITEAAGGRPDNSQAIARMSYPPTLSSQIRPPVALTVEGVALFRTAPDASLPSFLCLLPPRVPSWARPSPTGVDRRW
jgi:hypothetical protein